MDEQELDITKLKYVLYARKSTDDPQRQVRSIGDQITECRNLAQRLGLKIVKILEETKSAKKPNLRPVFTQMLKDIRVGKYDAILAWNPDRLARNMKEAGEIIDMVDEDVIKDMKFVTHHFSKDANGKMLLGMSFVLSKQYSDDLSQKVTRGVRGQFKEGKTPIPKHGYIRDEDGLYRPDDKNYYLIQQAWHLRSEGESYEKIVKHLDDNEYKKVTKRGREIKMKKQMLTKMFKDPFYYGILIQNGQTNDLREIYNFKPLITDDIYNQVQRLAYRRIKPAKPHKTAFYPLRQMLICSFCGGNMYIAPSTGHDRYLYARCDNLPCDRTKKSIRMGVIFDYIYALLDGGLNLDKKDYDNYYQKTIKISDKNRNDLKVDIHSKQGSLKIIKREIKEIGLAIPRLKSVVRQINENKIEELGDQQTELEEQIETLSGKITSPEEDALSLKDFLNFSKNASLVVQSGSARVKDLFCRKIFLNFTISETKVLSYQLKEPFLSMIKHKQMSSSRGERTRTSGLAVPNGAL